ncbi:hypothetical protein M0804_012833 [Polistes exclamans]|nr:hypothetical protein M0804_012833 [Polistes exclamans]
MMKPLTRIIEPNKKYNTTTKMVIRMMGWGWKQEEGSEEKEEEEGAMVASVCGQDSAEAPVPTKVWDEDVWDGTVERWVPEGTADNTIYYGIPPARGNLNRTAAFACNTSKQDEKRVGQIANGATGFHYLLLSHGSSLNRRLQDSVDPLERTL